jgi:hypothetical protein
MLESISETTQHHLLKDNNTLDSSKAKMCDSSDISDNKEEFSTESKKKTETGVRGNREEQPPSKQQLAYRSLLSVSFTDPNPFHMSCWMEITRPSVLSEIIKWRSCTVVYVHAKWHSACRSIEEELETFADKYNKYNWRAMKFCKVDGALGLFNVDKLPTFFIFQNTDLYRVITGPNLDQVDLVLQELGMVSPST